MVSFSRGPDCFCIGSQDRREKKPPEIRSTRRMLLIINDNLPLFRHNILPSLTVRTEYLSTMDSSDQLADVPSRTLRTFRSSSIGNIGLVIMWVPTAMDTFCLIVSGA